jgi:hypothetical protein
MSRTDSRSRLRTDRRQRDRLHKYRYCPSRLLGLVEMQDDSGRAAAYRALSAQMRAKAHLENDVRRRAALVRLAEQYAEIADTWDRIMQPSAAAASGR